MGDLLFMIDPKEYQAEVNAAKAKLERANLDLGYTRITAPIRGRVGRNLVDIGNLVGEGEPTLLTEISRFDPMHVYFNINENDLLQVLAMYRKRITEKGLNPETDPDIQAEIPIFLGIANEEGFPHEGVMDFAESGVDPETGTLRVRGVFSNSGLAPVLVPGLFARIRMPISKNHDALPVSERACRLEHHLPG